MRRGPPGLWALALALALAACDGRPSVLCGDGVVAGEEQCDDGNLSFLDDCLPGCKLATCGDLVVRHAPADAADCEACDPGGVDTAGCDVDCSAAVCGDGVVNRAAGEACDDGNTVSADGCRADCRSDESCGNRIRDRHLPRSAQTHPLVCRSADQAGTGCAEVCDDGNTVSGDGCSANCLSDETCQNHIVDQAAGEVCDDGNFRNFDGCTNACLPAEVCGDGRVDLATEACDDGPQETPSCDRTVDPLDPQNCTHRLCGDGHRNPVAGEQCDDGNGSLIDDCPGCRDAVCGDGATDQQPPGIEECDDGNAASTDNCTAACRVAVCGDGFRDIAPPGIEACDLGAMNGQPGAPCSAGCTVVR